MLGFSLMESFDSPKASCAQADPVALFLRSLWDGLLPSEFRQDPELLRSANRVAALHLAMLIWVPVFGISLLLAGRA